MISNKKTGEMGEKEVIKLISCPNCEKDLMQLPKDYPLYDVQCTGCSFRAQVKSISSKPKKQFLGAGWEIIDKVLKSGFMVPPIFTNFKWIEKGVKKQEIRFYPFIPKINLNKYQLSPTAKRANYKLFHYINMDLLPYFKVYEK
ncbi:DpnI domain-containing protein [Flavobacterium sp.]|uniref:DpnI domain-containing protein n=1 Tax=Flavobacterium sp. TaxID=239 RepID=UPI003BD5F759